MDDELKVDVFIKPTVPIHQVVIDVPPEWDVEDVKRVIAEYGEEKFISMVIAKAKTERLTPR